MDGNSNGGVSSSTAPSSAAPDMGTVAPTPAQWAERLRELGAPAELERAIVRMAEMADELAELRALAPDGANLKQLVRLSPADQQTLDSLCALLGEMIGANGKAVPTSRANILQHVERMKSANLAAADERAALSAAWRSISKALG